MRGDRPSPLQWASTGPSARGLEVAADPFLSITLGRVAKAALYGVPFDQHQRSGAPGMAVDVFLNGHLDKR